MLVQEKVTESITSDQRSKSLLLIPGQPFGYVFQMSAAGNEGAPCQSCCGKTRKQHPGFPATNFVWRL